MDPESYEQVMINKGTVGEAMKFVKENETVKICSYNGNVFSIEPPLFVELEVTETEPGFAGNTALGRQQAGDGGDRSPDPGSAVR